MCLSICENLTLGEKKCTNPSTAVSTPIAELRAFFTACTSACRFTIRLQDNIRPQVTKSSTAMLLLLCYCPVPVLDE
jgi:hypothetical protein